jgi:hypothetical protein
MHSSSDPDASASKILVMPKLRAPASRPEQMGRPRMLELLRGSSECKITLVSAPAGYGKTTLLAQWSQSEETPAPVAWVSLDGQDNDPTRLWRHIVEALHRATPKADFVSDVLVGMSVALSGRGDEGERLLGFAESAEYEGPLLDGTLSIEAGGLNARAVFGFGGVRSTLEAARRAVALDADPPTLFTPLVRFALVRFGLGSSLYLSGETSSARGHFEDALEWAGADQPMLRMVILSLLSIVDLVLARERRGGPRPDLELEDHEEGQEGDEEGTRAQHFAGSLQADPGS